MSGSELRLLPQFESGAGFRHEMQVPGLHRGDKGERMGNDASGERQIDRGQRSAWQKLGDVLTGRVGHVVKWFLNALLVLFITFIAFLEFPSMVVETPPAAIDASQLLPWLLLIAVLRCLTSEAATSFVWPPADLQTKQAVVSSITANRDVQAFARRFDDGNKIVRTLMEALLVPPTRFSRIDEAVELLDTKYAFTVNFEILFAEGDPETVLLPVLTPRKGVMLPGLTISSSQGQASILPYHETNGAILTGVRVLIDRSTLTDPEKTSLSETFDTIIGGASTAERDDSVAQQWVTRLSGMADNKIAHALSSLLSAFEIGYCVLAVIHRDAKPATTLTLSYRLPARTQTDAPDNVLRLAAGLGVRRHRFRLSNAYRGASYHWTTTVPEGLYVYAVRLSKLVISERRAPSDVQEHGTDSLLAEIGTPIIRHESTLGYDYVHVHARDLREPSEPNADRWQYQLGIDLRERPPGLLAVLLLLNGYLALLIWGVGHYHDKVFPPVNITDPSSNWPTILFGIPALISGWLLARFTPTAIRWVSMVTLLLTGWTVVNAFAAVSIAALKLSVAQTDVLHAFGLNINHPVWSAVMLSSGLLLVACVLVLFVRSFRYITRMTAQDRVSN